MTLFERPAGDVQQARRLTSVADCDACDDADALARYCRHFPNGRLYAEQLGFRLYRLEPLRFYYNGGFATARWLSADRLLTDRPFTSSTEQSLLRRLRAQRSGQLRRLLALGTVSEADSAAFVALDRWGLTLRDGEQLQRLHAQQPIDDWESLATVIDQT